MLATVTVVGACSTAPATGESSGRSGTPAATATTSVRPSGSTTTSRPAAAVHLPPTTGAFDYQLDEPYPPAGGVTVVVRDRESPSPSDRYGVCYVNAFQTQPQDRDAWLRDRAALVLRHASGAPVTDPGWPGELLIDIGRPALRQAAATVVSAQLDTCVGQGFEAVELDNLDSWTRSGGRLTQADAAAYARLLVAAAHARGLAVAQKNTVELLDAPGRPAFDFAVTEDCGRYEECGAFTRVYGTRVLDVEYTDRGFAAACRTSPSVRVVRRDLELVAPGGAGHVLRYCTP
ncbi:endo alpha-1,4 polygalactosaminidase [Phycicoccus sp. Root563]|uniref:endo alpha-1,4 polygalactosaminidase n=1 Tax=Phycicoccus sp. Root563 TaxID=1736562 RepID=UPI000A86B15E|nr:endo alpha-1,4 polygalactosaminidase [Phycicoccus sp. Root563]